MIQTTGIFTSGGGGEVPTPVGAGREGVYPSQSNSAATWTGVCLELVTLVSFWLTALYFELPVADSNVTMNIRAIDGTVLSQRTGLSIDISLTKVPLTEPIYVPLGTFLSIEFLFSSGSRAFKQISGSVYNTTLYRALGLRGNTYTGTFYNNMPYILLLEYGTESTISASMHLDGDDNTGTGHSGSATSWKDLIGTVANATKIDGTITWGTNHLVFDGSTGWRVNAPNGSVGTMEIVVSIDSTFVPVNTSYWYKASCIFGCELGGAQRDFGVLINSSGYFAIGYADSTIFSTNIYALDGNPHTIAYNYDGGPRRIYIDGNLFELFLTTVSGSAVTTVGIGWNNAGSGTRIKGKIYMIKWYNALLGISQAKANHSAYKTKYGF